MECVVCFDPISNPNPPCCADPACLGGSAVCESCSEILERCVYCREPRRPIPEPKNFMARVYLALYYASVIGYVMGQFDDAELDLDVDYWDSGSDPDSEPESLSTSIAMGAGGVLHS